MVQTARGPMPHAGSMWVDGVLRRVGVGCYRGGNAALVAVDADGSIWSVLTRNETPWRLSPWHALASLKMRDPAQTFATADRLIALPDPASPGAFVIMPPAWRRDEAGDLYAIGDKIAIGCLGTLWGLFIDEQLIQRSVKPTQAGCAVYALNRLRAQRQNGIRHPAALLALPRKDGAPWPQLDD